MRSNDETSRGPEDDFRSLRERATPELDSVAAWRRLRAALPERRPAVGWTALRWKPLTAAAGAVLVFGLALAQLWPGDALPPAAGHAAGSAARPATGADATPVTETAPAVDADLVLLAGVDPAGAPEITRVDVAEPRLSVRLLLRGAPDEAVLGAGGGDVAGDLRGTLAAVLPGRDYGVIGAWQGLLAPGEMATELAPGYTLTFEVDAADGSLLRRVRVSGERGPLVAQEMRLEAGRVYLFGVRDAAGRTDDMLLAVRLEPAPRDPEPSR